MTQIKNLIFTCNLFTPKLNIMSKDKGAKEKNVKKEPVKNLKEKRKEKEIKKKEKDSRNG